MDTQITPEQQEDIEKRVQDFRARHIANVEELEVDFIAYPQYAQVGPNIYSTYMNMQIVDKKYAPIPSPLNDEMAAEVADQASSGDDVIAG